MGLIVVLILIGGVLVIAVDQVRPAALRRVPLGSASERALTYIVITALLTLTLFLFLFLGVGLIQYFPAAFGEAIWLIVTALLIGIGAAGELLLKDRRPTTVSLVCLILGLVSLFLWTIGRLI